MFVMVRIDQPQLDHQLAAIAHAKAQGVIPFKKVVEGKFELKLNEGKTFTFDLRDSNKQCELEYLGYKIFL